MAGLKTVSIFGATGSVGQSTLDVIKANPDSFDVKVLTANSNADALAEQALEFKPEKVAIADDTAYPALKDKLSGSGIEIMAGREGLLEAAELETDLTMAAIVGMAGLEPLMGSLKHGKQVAIANKEPLVAAGGLVMETARDTGATLLPVDSEHNAIFQVFEESNRDSIAKLILTASGGPFRTASVEDMAKVTPEQAIAHPNWSMGAKISVDSATMMNKALEVIEAHHLFQMPDKMIEVIVHPQSVIHSMVEYNDGSVLAQLGAPDMRTPIAYALAWPKRIGHKGEKLNWQEISKLEFEQVDNERFPLIKLAYECIKKGQAACITFNAANEIAVQAFLERRIGFLDIYGVISEVLAGQEALSLANLDEIIEYDNVVRDIASSYINQMNGKNTGTHP